MKKHIKEAWLAHLTPEWWKTRAKGWRHDGAGHFCANGLLWTLAPQIESLAGNEGVYSMENRVAVATANDRGTYEELLAAVHAIPEEP